MFAWQLHHPAPIESNPLQWEEMTFKALEPDQVLVKIKACGVCHTDLHVCEGDLPQPTVPIIPGHQILGQVVQRGSKVFNLEEGQWVGIAWLHETCGGCSFCQKGLENLCPHARFTGWHVPGGYGEYTVARAPYIFLWDEEPIPQEAPLLCGGIVGYRALRVGGIQPGEKVGLYGFGSSAHMVLQVLRAWGCPVSVVTRSPDHQALARTLGAWWAGRREDNPPTHLDCIIVFAPVGSLLVDALQHVRPGGRVVSAGIHMSDLPGFPYQYIYKEKVLTTVANATREDGARFLSLARELNLQIQAECFPMQEAPKVLRMLKEGKLKASAVLTM